MSAEIAYKFLKAGQLPSHGSGIWIPGEERSVSPPIVPCQYGIHYCLPKHLSRWVNEELWLFEDLDREAAIEHEESKMVTTRGRIIERVEAWTPAVWQKFAFIAADRAVRIHAVRALRAAGLTDEAQILEDLHEIDSIDSARSAADSAYSVYSAYSAAYSAVYSAYSAAYSAADSAYSAYSAARSAARSAYSAYSAYSAAYSAEYEYLSNVILDLVRGDSDVR